MRNSPRVTLAWKAFTVLDKFFINIQRVFQDMYCSQKVYPKMDDSSFFGIIFVNIFFPGKYLLKVYPLCITLRISRRHSNRRGTTCNISCGQFGSETTAQDKLRAARRISGSASPVTSLPAFNNFSKFMLQYWQNTICSIISNQTRYLYKFERPNLDPR